MVKANFKIKYFLKIIYFTVIMLFLIGCSKKTEAIEFSNSEIVINVGDNIPLETTISPIDATNQKMEFISADDTIVFVEDNILYARSAGTAIITVKQNEVEYDFCEIIVPNIVPEQISCNSQIIDLGVGRTKDLIVDFIPKNTTNKNIKYISEDISIATIEGNTLQGVAEGSTVVTAIHESGLKASCVVNISPVILESIQIKGVSALELYDTEQLTFSCYPNDATDKSMTWLSSNSNILSIDTETKEITANKIGVAIITAISDLGIEDSKEIEVTPIYAKSISISTDSTNSIYCKEEIVLTAKILPENTTDKTIIWSSNNESIATVKNGKIKGIGSGSALIKATLSNNVETSFKVIVKPTTQNMKVSISKSCSNYNHVGNEWYSYYSINGSVYSSGDIIPITRNSNINIYTEIMEDDTILDMGACSYKMYVDTECFENGFTVTQTIDVYENRGRYSGNGARWIVEYNFSNP